METILLMLSGGIDSTYLLHYYLTETDYPIHVHHISLRYPQFQRWRMEDPAVQKVLEYCITHCRDFEYSESRFDMEPMSLVGLDQALQLVVASKVAPNLPGDKVSVALGHCADDYDTPEAQERVRSGVMDNLWMALRDAGPEKEKLDPHRAKPMVDLGLTKKNIIERMPPALLRLCWSCRMPEFVGKTGLPCGQCSTCRKLAGIFEKLGRTAEVPNLVRQRKSTEGASRGLERFVTQMGSGRFQ